MPDPITEECVKAIDALLDAMDNHEGCTTNYDEREVAARTTAIGTTDDHDALGTIEAAVSEYQHLHQSHATLLDALKDARDAIIDHKIDIQTDVLHTDEDGESYYLCLDEVLSDVIALAEGRDA